MASLEPPLRHGPVPRVVHQLQAHDRGLHVPGAPPGGDEVAQHHVLVEVAAEGHRDQGGLEVQEAPKLQGLQDLPERSGLKRRFKYS